MKRLILCLLLIFILNALTGCAGSEPQTMMKVWRLQSGTKTLDLSQINLYVQNNSFEMRWLNGAVCTLGGETMGNAYRGVFDVTLSTWNNQGINPICENYIDAFFYEVEENQLYFCNTNTACEVYD